LRNLRRKKSLKFRRHKIDYSRTYLYVKNVRARLEQTLKKFLKARLNAGNVIKQLSGL